MPKFSDLEKERIYHTILNKGKELFSLYGLKKTSIDDIVNQCGIGKGTFYRFFDSKEILFFKIAEEEERFREPLIVDMLSSPLPPKESFRQFLKKCIHYIDQNPFLKRFNDQHELEALYRKLPQEMIEQHIKEDEKSSMLFLEKWISEGVLKEEDPKVIVGILRSLFLFIFFKDEVGHDLFPIVLDRYINYVVDGLFI